MTENDIVRELISFQEPCVEYLQKQRRFGKFTNLNDEDLEDVCRNVLLAVYEKVEKYDIRTELDGLMILVNGKLQPLKLHSYFWQACYQHAIKVSEKKNRERPESQVGDRTMNDEGEVILPPSITKSYNAKAHELFNAFSLDEDEVSIVRLIVKHLPSYCEEILWSFYEDCLSLQEIADRMAKSVDVIKTEKSRCMSKLYNKKEQIMNLFPYFKDLKSQKKNTKKGS